MKIYDFTKKERDSFVRVVFALTIDKKRMTERVIIGLANEVKLALELGEGKVYYDKVRPLGRLFSVLGFHSVQVGNIPFDCLYSFLLVD